MYLFSSSNKFRAIHLDPVMLDGPGICVWWVGVECILLEVGMTLSAAGTFLGMSLISLLGEAENKFESVL